MKKKYIYIFLAATVFLAFLVWLFIESSKPLPGTKVTDLGREHVPIGEKVEYNSNPPTSGKHYAEWVKSGVYTEPKDDRNLLHSLEHGYVIMSYNCDKPPATGFIPQVLAHGTEEATPSSEATPSANLSENFRSDDCHKLVDQLISIYEKKGKNKLIVVPRENLDSNFALTAWTYLDKFNEFDQNRIEKFIDAYLNMGPEKTME